MPLPSVPSRLPLPIGQLLSSAGLVSAEHVEQCARIQKETGELLGLILVRHGVIDARDTAAALTVQEEVRSTLAWGARDEKPPKGYRLPGSLRVGELLLARGELLRDDLERALTGQARSGRRLGETLVELGAITVKQLNAVLDLQLRLAVAILSACIGFAPSAAGAAATTAAHDAAPTPIHAAVLLRTNRT